MKESLYYVQAHSKPSIKENFIIMIKMVAVLLGLTGKIDQPTGHGGGPWG